MQQCDIVQGIHVGDCEYRKNRQRRIERWDAVTGNTAKVEVRRILDTNKAERDTRRIADCSGF